MSSCTHTARCKCPQFRTGKRFRRLHDAETAGGLIWSLIACPDHGRSPALWRLSEVADRCRLFASEVEAGLAWLQRRGQVERRGDWVRLPAAELDRLARVTARLQAEKEAAAERRAKRLAAGQRRAEREARRANDEAIRHEVLEALGRHGALRAGALEVRLGHRVRATPPEAARAIRALLDEGVIRRERRGRWRVLALTAEGSA